MRSFLSIQYVHGDLCKHVGIDSSRSVLESIPKCLHKSLCGCRILKNDLIQYLPLPVYEVPAIRVITTKSTYTFTSVYVLQSRLGKDF